MKFLAAVDFSENSINGLNFAIDLCEFLNVDLTILHVFNPLLLVEDPENRSRPKEEFIKESLLETVIKKSQLLNSPIRYSLEICKGNAVDTITQKAEKERFDLVIIGNRDKHGLLDRWLGTVSTGVSQQCRRPVLIVPNGSRFIPFKKILVASDYHIKEKDQLNFIRQWNAPFQAYTNFLHVQHSEEDLFIEETKSIIQRYYEEEEADFSFEINLIKNEDISSTIYKTSIQENADLIILTAENKSRLQTILTESISNDLVIQSVKPLLILHTSKAEI